MARHGPACLPLLGLAPCRPPPPCQLKFRSSNRNLWQDNGGAAAAAAAGGDGKQLKRLRKAGGDAPAAAAAPAADELEDAEASPAAAAAPKRRASPTPKGKGRARSGSPDGKAAAVKKAAAKALAEADSEAAELSASTSSEAEAEEGEEAQSSPASSAKKKGSAQKLALSRAGAKGAKVEGVGTGAIKAAAVHGTFDLRRAFSTGLGRRAAAAGRAAGRAGRQRQRQGGATRGTRAHVCVCPCRCLPPWGPPGTLCWFSCPARLQGSLQPTLPRSPLAAPLCSKLATWEAGKPVPFSFLADTFDAIAETTKVRASL